MAGLFEYVVNKKMETTKNKFWGKYSELNTAMPPLPSEEAIHNYQLIKLRNSELAIAKAAEARMAKFKIISDIIINTDSNDVAQYENNRDKEIAEAIQNIFTNISEMRQTHKVRDINGNFKSKEQKIKDVEIMQNIMQNLLNELTRLQNTLNVQEVAYADNLENIKNALNALQGATGFYRADFKKFWKTLSQTQGDLLEELGTAWFNERIPKDLEVTMITTGNVAYYGNDHKGQLIMDMMTINMNAPEVIDNLNITYRIGSKGEEKTMPIKDFLQKLPQYNGSEKIILTDSGYNLLTNISVMNIQAKSGKKQLPWNMNKSTQVAISEYADDVTESGNLSVLQTFKLLHALDNEQPRDEWVLNEDSLGYYQALANYGLATVLYKVLHLDEVKGNQYLLTPDGFMTFSQRFLQLFEKNKGYVQLKGRVFDSGHFKGLENKYNVTVPQSLLS